MGNKSRESVKLNRAASVPPPFLPLQRLSSAASFPRQWHSPHRGCDPCLSHRSPAVACPEFTALRKLDVRNF